MELLNAFLHNSFSFIILISVIVFIHEFGHYFIARLCGVRVEVFSIGFGPELFGWNDKSGTRWKISALPFGGYVKMFGDMNAASAPDAAKIHAMTEAEKKVAFHTKPLAAKAAVVSAGPIFNLLSAIIILAAMFMWYGKPFALPEINEVKPGSPAAEAGLNKGDIILSINNTTVKSFTDIQRMVTLHPQEKLAFTIRRGTREETLYITPALSERKDAFGNVIRTGMIGIASPKTIYEKQSLIPAFASGVVETWNISGAMLVSLGQIITGKRSTDELGGPIKIAQYSGQSTSNGMQTILWFIVIISINLGVVNLFPIPVLDGGHLMYYAIEAVTGKPAAERFYYYSFRIGALLLLSLMVFSIVNDIRHL